MSRVRRAQESSVARCKVARAQILCTPQRPEFVGFIEAQPEISVSPPAVAIFNHLALEDLLEADALVNPVTGGFQSDAFACPMPRDPDF
jgi:hypothetical protein